MSWWIWLVLVLAAAVGGFVTGVTVLRRAFVRRKPELAGLQRAWIRSRSREAAKRLTTIVGNPAIASGLARGAARNDAEWRRSLDEGFRRTIERAFHACDDGGGES